MHVRHAMTLLAIAGLLVIPATSAVGSGGAMASANGSAHWTIPLPNQFGVVVENRTSRSTRGSTRTGRSQAGSSTTRWSRVRRSSSTSTSRA